MKTIINANQVVTKNEKLNTIELYESYEDNTKKYLIAFYSTVTHTLCYVDVYSINDCIDFMKYLDDNNYTIESVIDC